MTFNKWFPQRTEPRPGRVSGAARAWVLRGAWYVSTLLLMLGYVLLFVHWDA